MYNNVWSIISESLCWFSDETREEFKSLLECIHLSAKIIRYSECSIEVAISICQMPNYIGLTDLQDLVIYLPLPPESYGALAPVATLFHRPCFHTNPCKFRMTVLLEYIECFV